jgi:hypothetical protein
MLALEPIEPGVQARLRAAERRKVQRVLDLVMAVHSGDEPTEARRGDHGELCGRRATVGVVVCGKLEPGGVAAQVLVYLEPKLSTR